MKTLTEFSTLTLRKAAEARASFRGAPAHAAPAAETPAEGDAPAAEGEPPAEAAKPADPAIDHVATTLGVQPDRAARLLEALDIVGGNIDAIRLVRVYQGETGPHGAVSRGEFHYVLDRVAGPQKARRDRDERGGDRGGRGGDRGGRGGGGGGGGGGGFGGRGDRDKPRGLGSLVHGAVKEEKKDDDRPGRGEMPRAGIGWQLTAAPRDFGGEGRGKGRGGPRRGPGGPGGDRRDRRGPGGPGGPGGGRDRGPRPPRLGPDGQPLPFEARNDRGPRGGGGGDRGPRPPRPPREPRLGPDGQPLPPEPRLGPDGQPLPPRPKRERKPIGPDANGLGPDGKPWDPERRAKRQAEREATMNAPAGSSVEAQPMAEAPKE